MTPPVPDQRALRVQGRHSHQEVACQCRQAALAWEAAFLQLARTELTDMAHAANLSISYSAERSIQDEISRESFADASTVAWSYAAMLVYVSLALASVPGTAVARLGWGKALLVHSRLGLGVGGVAIVVAAVLGALGLTSLCGAPSSLISLEACSHDLWHHFWESMCLQAANRGADIHSH